MTCPRRLMALPEVAPTQAPRPVPLIPLWTRPKPPGLTLLSAKSPITPIPLTAVWIGTNSWGAFNAETSVEAVAVKYRVLNSAEGGVNAALNELAEDPNATPKCYPGTLNSMIYSGCIVLNNLNNGNSKKVLDPATGTNITVPGNSAYLYGESDCYSVSRRLHSSPGAARCMGDANSVNSLTHLFFSV